MKSQTTLPMYHHYANGRECVARFPMHADRGGAWFTGPITRNEDGTWDESKANEIFVSRQKDEKTAINFLRRKLGEPPPGAGPGEGWNSIAAENKAQGMSIKEMAAKGLLTG